MLVCAPSLIPKKPGERVETDRRDAIRLVRSMRAGELSSVYVPGVEDEAFRNLPRAWASARDDLQHAKQCLKSFLLVHGSHRASKLGFRHRRWLSKYSFESTWRQVVFDEHRRTIDRWL